MPATPQTRAELEDLLVAYISDPLNKQNSAAAVREVIRAVFNSSYNRADDPLNPSTPPGAASYGTITGVPEDSPSLDNRLSTIRALANRSPNRANNNTKAVKWLTNADREAAGGTDADGETAEDSFPLHTAGTNPLNLGTVFRAESGLEGVLVYDDGTNTDPAIPRLANVFRDGGQTVAGQPAMLVLVGSPEAAGANIRVIDNVIADWGLNETGKIIIGGSYAYFGTNAAGGPFTPPTALAGNANWHPEAEPLAPNQFYQVLSVATAQAIALADNAIHPITYRILRGSDGTSRRGDVVVQGIAFSPATESGEGDIPARFATLGLWLNPITEQWVEALYDIATDAVTAIDFERLAGLSNPFYSADPADDTKIRGFLSLEDAADALYGAGLVGSYIQFLGSYETLLTRNVLLPDPVELVGHGDRFIRVPSGITFDFDGTAALNGISAVVDAGGSVPHFRISTMNGGYLRGVFNNPTGHYFNVDLTPADFTGTGYLYLYGNTSDPGSVAPGIVVHDLRPNRQVLTTNDIEITDLTKGVIQHSPDGARWRLAVSNTGVVTATLA